MFEDDTMLETIEKKGYILRKIKLCSQYRLVNPYYSFI